MANKNNNKKRIEFDLPEGFPIPDQLSESGEFDALATIQIKEDGTACLVALEGYRMPGYTEDDGPSANDKSYSEAVSEGVLPEGY